MLNTTVKSLIIALALWLPAITHAQMSTWTPDQQKWYVASNLLLLADWATTRDMTRRYDEGFQEHNILLGRHPSRDKVDFYFATVLLGHYFATDWLGSKNRDTYLVGITIIEGAVVKHNLGIGLRLRF